MRSKYGFKVAKLISATCRLLCGGVVVTSMGSLPAMAESYSAVSTVKGITAGLGYVRVQLADMTQSLNSAESGCTGGNALVFFNLDMSMAQAKEIYAGILSHKSTKEKLSFQLNGCQNSLPNISMVYLCDTVRCQ